MATDIEHQRPNSDTKDDGNSTDKEAVVVHQEFGVASIHAIDDGERSLVADAAREDIPSWRKHIHLILMALHGFFVTSNASGIVPVGLQLAEIQEADHD